MGRPKKRAHRGGRPPGTPNRQLSSESDDKSSRKRQRIDSRSENETPARKRIHISSDSESEVPVEAVATTSSAQTP